MLTGILTQFAFIIFGVDAGIIEIQLILGSRPAGAGSGQSPSGISMKPVEFDPLGSTLV